MYVCVLYECIWDDSGDVTRGAAHRVGLGADRRHSRPVFDGLELFYNIYKVLGI